MLKKQFAFVLLIFSCTVLLAQPDSQPDNTDSTETGLISQADQMPYFKGCSAQTEGSVEKRNCSNQALITFIGKNLEIPQKSQEVGAVYVSFTVDEYGKVVSPAILRGVSKEQDEAALRVVKAMPDWEPALLKEHPVKVKMTLPIRFTRKDESEFSNGFQLTWGTLKGQKTTRDELAKYLATPITVRDESGNPLEINELMFERERNGKFLDAQSNGSMTDTMQRLIKKLKHGDYFTVTATVQKKGQFYYVDKSFIVD